MKRLVRFIALLLVAVLAIGLVGSCIRSTGTGTGGGGGVTPDEPVVCDTHVDLNVDWACDTCGAAITWTVSVKESAGGDVLYSFISTSEGPKIRVYLLPKTNYVLSSVFVNGGDKTSLVVDETLYLEYFDGCAYEIIPNFSVVEHTCIDENTDQACDICGATMPETEPEELVLCTCDDQSGYDSDFRCYNCGGHVHERSSCVCVRCGYEYSDHRCYDDSGNCYECGKKIDPATCMHVDDNGSHLCDNCGQAIVYNATVVQSDYGTVMVSPGSYTYGQDVVITVSPLDGYYLSSLLVNGSDMVSSVVGNSLTLSATGDYKIGPTFKQSVVYPSYIKDSYLVYDYLDTSDDLVSVANEDQWSFNSSKGEYSVGKIETAGDYSSYAAATLCDPMTMSSPYVLAAGRTVSFTFKLVDYALVDVYSYFGLVFYDDINFSSSGYSSAGLLKLGSNLYGRSCGLYTGEIGMYGASSTNSLAATLSNAENLLTKLTGDGLRVSFSCMSVLDAGMGSVNAKFMVTIDAVFIGEYTVLFSADSTSSIRFGLYAQDCGGVFSDVSVS